MKKIVIGIDNGGSGSIGIIREGNAVCFKSVPTKRGQDYTKKRKDITRLNIEEFKSILKEADVNSENSICFLERPMINPTRFKATQSALRVLEGELIALEENKIPYIFLDSKQWQRKLLPQGTKGEELKKMSRDIGERLFPMFKKEIEKQKDADGLLIAYFGSMA